MQKKKERAHGPFKRSWASYDILFCSLARTTVFAKTMSCHGPQATANSQTHACSHFTTTRWHGVLHTKRSDFGGQRSFAFATFRLVLFTTFFTAPMGRCKIQRGAFTFGVSHWYTPTASRQAAVPVSPKGIPTAPSPALCCSRWSVLLPRPGRVCRCWGRRLPRYALMGAGGPLDKMQHART